MHRGNPTLPLYEQLKIALRNDILNGEYVEGSLIPSERELCERYNVSRITAKRAVDELTADGLLTRIQGKGTLVRSKMVPDTFAVAEGFSEQARRNGAKPSSRILSIEKKDADGHLLEVFGKSRIFTPPFTAIKRLLCQDDRPVALVTSYVPEPLGSWMSQLELSDASLYSLITQFTGLRVHRSVAVLNPVVPTADTAELLKVSPMSAHFHCRIISYFENGEPVEMSVGVYSADEVHWVAERYDLKKGGRSDDQ